MLDDLTDQGRAIFDIVNFEIICIIVGSFGIGANVINMIIFYKQGWGNTVNIAFFSLAISDFCCLILMEWFCICINPLLSKFGVPWHLLDVAFLSASWPHVCFCRITSYITVYITAERYLSIAFPLQLKDMVTARKTTFVICIIYVINTIVVAPEYVSFYLGWKSVPDRNTTILSLMVTSNRAKVEGVENVLHSLLSMASFVGVVMLTIALVTKLRQSSDIRKELISGNKGRGAMSNKEQKTVKMVVLIATVLIVCYTPGIVISFTTYIIGPEFNILGRYVNICIAMWSFAYAFQAMNSSINIILYYNMSSNYKRILDELFLKKLKSYMKW